MIKLSDKGGNVVVMDHDECQSMCLKMFPNSERCQSIETSMLLQFQQEFYGIVDRAYQQSPTDKDILDFVNFNILFQVKHPKTLTFYHLPKMHKNRVEPPGYLIVSNSG